MEEEEVLADAGGVEPCSPSGAASLDSSVSTDSSVSVGSSIRESAPPSPTTDGGDGGAGDDAHGGDAAAAAAAARVRAQQVQFASPVARVHTVDAFTPSAFRIDYSPSSGYTPDSSPSDSPATAAAAPPAAGHSGNQRLRTVPRFHLPHDDQPDSAASAAAAAAAYHAASANPPLPPPAWRRTVPLDPAALLQRAMQAATPVQQQQQQQQQQHLQQRQFWPHQEARAAAPHYSDNDSPYASSSACPSPSPAPPMSSYAFVDYPPLSPAMSPHPHSAAGGAFVPSLPYSGAALAAAAAAAAAAGYPPLPPQPLPQHVDPRLAAWEAYYRQLGMYPPPPPPPQGMGMPMHSPYATPMHSSAPSPRIHSIPGGAAASASSAAAAAAAATTPASSVPVGSLYYPTRPTWELNEAELDAQIAAAQLDLLQLHGDDDVLRRVEAHRARRRTSLSSLSTTAAVPKSLGAHAPTASSLGRQAAPRSSTSTSTSPAGSRHPDHPPHSARGIAAAAAVTAAASGPTPTSSRSRGVSPAPVSGATGPLQAQQRSTARAAAAPMPASSPLPSSLTISTPISRAHTHAARRSASMDNAGGSGTGNGRAQLYSAPVTQSQAPPRSSFMTPTASSALKVQQHQHVRSATFSSALTTPRQGRTGASPRPTSGSGGAVRATGRSARATHSNSSSGASTPRTRGASFSSSSAAAAGTTGSGTLLHAERERIMVASLPPHTARMTSVPAPVPPPGPARDPPASPLVSASGGLGMGLGLGYGLAASSGLGLIHAPPSAPATADVAAVGKSEPNRASPIGSPRKRMRVIDSADLADDAELIAASLAAASMVSPDLSSTPAPSASSAGLANPAPRVIVKPTRSHSARASLGSATITTTTQTRDAPVVGSATAAAASDSSVHAAAGADAASTPISPLSISCAPAPSSARSSLSIDGSGGNGGPLLAELRQYTLQGRSALPTADDEGAEALLYEPPPPAAPSIPFSHKSAAWSSAAPLAAPQVRLVKQASSAHSAAAAANAASSSGDSSRSASPFVQHGSARSRARPASAKTSKARTAERIAREMIQQQAAVRRARQQQQEQYQQQQQEQEQREQEQEQQPAVPPQQAQSHAQTQAEPQAGPFEPAFPDPLPSWLVGSGSGGSVNAASSRPARGYVDAPATSAPASALPSWLSGEPRFAVGLARDEAASNNSSAGLVTTGLTALPTFDAVANAAAIAPVAAAAAAVASAAGNWSDSLGRDAAPAASKPFVPILNGAGSHSKNQSMESHPHADLLAPDTPSHAARSISASSSAASSPSSSAPPSASASASLSSARDLLRNVFDFYAHEVSIVSSGEEEHSRDENGADGPDRGPGSGSGSAAPLRTMRVMNRTELFHFLVECDLLHVLPILAQRVEEAEEDGANRSDGAMSRGGTSGARGACFQLLWSLYSVSAPAQLEGGVSSSVNGGGAGGAGSPAEGGKVAPQRLFCFDSFSDLASHAAFALWPDVDAGAGTGVGRPSPSPSPSATAGALIHLLEHHVLPNSSMYAAAAAAASGGHGGHNDPPPAPTPRFQVAPVVALFCLFHLELLFNVHASFLSGPLPADMAAAQQRSLDALPAAAPSNADADAADTPAAAVRPALEYHYRRLQQVSRLWQQLALYQYQREEDSGGSDGSSDLLRLVVSSGPLFAAADGAADSDCFTLVDFVSLASHKRRFDSARGRLLYSGSLTLSLLVESVLAAVERRVRSLARRQGRDMKRKERHACCVAVLQSFFSVLATDPQEVTAP